MCGTTRLVTRKCLFNRSVTLPREPLQREPTTACVQVLELPPQLCCRLGVACAAPNVVSSMHPFCVSWSKRREIFSEGRCDGWSWSWSLSRLETIRSTDAVLIVSNGATAAATRQRRRPRRVGGHHAATPGLQRKGRIFNADQRTLPTRGRFGNAGFVFRALAMAIGQLTGCCIDLVFLRSAPGT